MSLIARAYELVTGTPWTTTRSATAEFGPTLAVRYPELARYSDAELYSRPLADILAEIRANTTDTTDATNALEELTR